MCFPKTPYFTNIIPPLKTKPEHGPLFTSHVAYFPNLWANVLRRFCMCQLFLITICYLDLYLCVRYFNFGAATQILQQHVSISEKSNQKLRSTTDKWYDPCNMPSKSQSGSSKDVKTLQILTCAWAIWSEEGLRHEWGDSWEKEESVSLGACWTVSRLGQRLIKL